MSTQTTRRDTGTDSSAFADIINHSNAESGADASRKAMLADCEAPYHVLDALGVEIPHRSFIDDPTDCIEFPHTIELPDGQRVHLHQDVREKTEDFGDFGAIDTSEETVVWTVTSLTDDTVTLKVVGEWKKTRHVPVEEFSEEYEPITLETPEGTVPKFGY